VSQSLPGAFFIHLERRLKNRSGQLWLCALAWLDDIFVRFIFTDTPIFFVCLSWLFGSFMSWRVVMMDGREGARAYHILLVCIYVHR
jgi:hypothetical protein